MTHLPPGVRDVGYRSLKYGLCEITLEAPDGRRATAQGRTGPLARTTALIELGLLTIGCEKPPPPAIEILRPVAKTGSGHARKAPQSGGRRVA